VHQPSYDDAFGGGFGGACGIIGFGGAGVTGSGIAGAVAARGRADVGGGGGGDVFRSKDKSTAGAAATGVAALGEGEANRIAASIASSMYGGAMSFCSRMRFAKAWAIVSQRVVYDDTWRVVDLSC
jgi:hypothetical protein